MPRPLQKPVNREFLKTRVEPPNVVRVRKLRNANAVPMSQNIPENSLVAPSCGRNGFLVGWRPVLSVRNPTEKKLFWPYLGATGEFLGMFWLIGTAFAVGNFLTLTMFFDKIAIYWVLEGSGHLEKFWAPNDKK